MSTVRGCPSPIPVVASTVSLPLGVPLLSVLIGAVASLGAMPVAAQTAESTESTSKEEVPTGHFPLLEAKLLGGLSGVPFSYKLGDSQQSEQTTGGVLGFGLRMNLDLHAALVFGEGDWNAYGGQVNYVLRAGVLFGGRSTQVPTIPGDYYVTTYPGQSLPVVYGLLVEVSTYRVNATTFDSAILDVQPTKGDQYLTSIAAGFGVVTGQLLEFHVAPAAELVTKKAGFIWGFKVGAPLGGHPWYFYMNGDHFFGAADTTRLSVLMVAGLGVGTGIGVRQ
jgi:hypothetical protein